MQMINISNCREEGLPWLCRLSNESTCWHRAGKQFSTRRNITYVNSWNVKPMEGLLGSGSCGAQLCSKSNDNLNTNLVRRHLFLRRNKPNKKNARLWNYHHPAIIQWTQTEESKLMLRLLDMYEGLLGIYKKKTSEVWYFMESVQHPVPGKQNLQYFTPTVTPPLTSNGQSWNSRGQLSIQPPNESGIDNRRLQNALLCLLTLKPRPSQGGCYLTQAPLLSFEPALLPRIHALEAPTVLQPSLFWM